MTGRAWGIGEGKKGRGRAVEATGRYSALLTVSRGKLEDSLLCALGSHLALSPSPEGNREGGGRFRNQGEWRRVWHSSQWAALERRAEAQARVGNP